MRKGEDKGLSGGNMSNTQNTFIYLYENLKDNREEARILRAHVCLSVLRDVKSKSICPGSVGIGYRDL